MTLSDRLDALAADLWRRVRLRLILPALWFYVMVGTILLLALLDHLHVL